jgi:hypothetical protein
MTNPTQTISFGEAALLVELNQLTFSNCGDDLERAYHERLNHHCPNIEVFWREFVVPLTNRIAPAGQNSEIRFREGVDPLLQYIAAANYSLFVNLALAREALHAWNNVMAQDAVYGRLASACDVFEALIIKFHLLISECRSLPPRPISDLKKEEFLELAATYFDKNYSTLKEHYLSIGKKTPPIQIPSNGSIIDEFFKAHGIKVKYQKAAGEVRTFRNPILHDVRLGMLQTADGGLLIPKPDVLHRYKKWHEVEKAAKDPAAIQRDFSDAKALCTQLSDNLMTTINDVYIVLLQLYRLELRSADCSTMRNLFGLRFETAVPTLIMPKQSCHKTNISWSFQTSNVSGISGCYPFPLRDLPDV